MRQTKTEFSRLEFDKICFFYFFNLNRILHLLRGPYKTIENVHFLLILIICAQKHHLVPSAPAAGLPTGLPGSGTGSPAITALPAAAPAGSSGAGPGTGTGGAAGAGASSTSPYVNLNAVLNQKDSRWLQLEVCREFQRNKCSRPDFECKFAHPGSSIEVQSGKVTACYDSIKVVLLLKAKIKQHF